MKARILVAATLAFLGMAAITPRKLEATTKPASTCCLPPPDCQPGQVCTQSIPPIFK